MKNQFKDEKMSTLKNHKNEPLFIFRSLITLLCCSLVVCILWPNQVFAQGPDGYIRCANEGQSYTLAKLSNVAFGVEGKFKYMYNQTGTITFNIDTFGGDPAPGVPKAGYYQEVDGGVLLTALSTSFSKIKDHLTGVAILSPAQINEQTTIIRDNIFVVGGNETVLTDALDVVSYYEQNRGPIFVNASTKGGFPNKWGELDGFELVRAIFSIQQGIHDYVYTPENVEKYATLFNGKKFGTSAYFPGACAVPTNPATAYTVKIDGSMPKYWGTRIANSTIPAIKPTGYYLASGSVGTVTVPQSMVNKGFTILVGCHDRDKSGSDKVFRFFRVAKSFPITNTVTHIANPFGGGVYIVTPYLADLGLVDVQIANVVPAPLFSARSYDQTTLQQWLVTQRKNKAPWTDFVTDKFMMTIPTSWIYNYADPVTLMKDWDMRMDVISELLGKPLVRNNYILYSGVDVSLMYGVFGIGYPQMNTTYNPNDVENGNKSNWYLKPGPNFWATEFHEAGHAQLFSNFDGEGEAAVNLLTVAILNKKYKVDIDKAFAYSSLYDRSRLSREQSAIVWMVTANFRAGKPMDISNSEANEVRYQQRGWGKYVEIAALFGWDVLGNFYKQENIDFEAQKPGDGLNETDSKMLRLSKSAGVDLRPLIHFWGVQPVNNVLLKTRLEADGLRPSRLIYDRLVHYKSLIPMNNTEFRAHANIAWPGVITSGESLNYGEGWYSVWLPLYNETHGAAAQIAMQQIIDLYFPNGRPEVTGIEPVIKDKSTSGAKSLSVFPNPASVSFALRTDDESKGSALVSIVNSAGVKVMEFQVKTMNDDRLKEIPVTNLDNGIYFVQMLLNHKDLYNTKIIVKK